MSKTKHINWEGLAEDLKDNRNAYHKKYYAKDTFNGPSLHFHQRALKTKGKEQIEMIYATLVSWGMHRQGNGGAKMNPFDVFRSNIFENRDTISQLSNKKIIDIQDDELTLLMKLFNSLNPMKTNSKIVAVSKVLAHLLNDIVCPIDRQYTFALLRGDTKTNRLKSWGDDEELFKNFHIKLIKPLAADADFAKYANQNIKNDEFPWDTSIPKVIDNLIIGKLLKVREDSGK